MALSGRQLTQYHVFLASPGDVSDERQYVRQFFDRYNQHTAQLWNVRFEVVGWDNYATIGVGRPQELITRQTLEKYRDSLALVIGIMGQRFGSPTGAAESGTEEEFNWAIESHQKQGFPEIKWFFRETEKLEMPTDPTLARESLEQWEKVLAFRQRMQNLDNPVFYSEYLSSVEFRDIFEKDLNRWLADSSRPWVFERAGTTRTPTTTLSPPSKYYENIERDFHRLDIAGIDNDRTFEIPLSEIYVRLRVMFDEGAEEETEDYEGGPIDIQTALLRYPKLVIVGDPGSGKSTFLKYIALMLARSFLTGNSTIAQEKLCLSDPLPVPIFLSCWDLADFLKQRVSARLNTLVEFIADRLVAYDFSISTDDVEKLLDSGNCCLLFDGLDEVPTDAGRAAVSRLLEDCIERYGDNRFLVTSRVRAYTGDTILKGKFTRCDIQPFNADDRAEFIRNWIALLFGTPLDHVEAEGTEARREFNSLTSGIEDSDRIRPLALNPLLLTVIAIVHWNRKRLPEQRVDLYDECIDVLLGQRKEAEHIQLNRKVGTLDEQHEEKTYIDRSWVRKRFAEIALYILSQDGDHDEATKADVIELLTPRFIDQGALNEEQAVTRAELFLDRQELRSGLLVSRRAQSYRFVHLTFQEYLAAWQLSNIDFDKVTEAIQSRLRLAKWFETLQLLGGQWAKESDDKADRYIAWLLENQGTTISERAPIVALCANIVDDINGIAELKLHTRSTFKEAVEDTLDAFREGSGVPAKTQVEILEALGQLGAAVKSHLIDATEASLYPVRRRAIEMLLPHLSDDELFAMDHIWGDRSKEPVKTYIASLLERDTKRTSQWVESTNKVPLKAALAALELSRGDFYEGYNALLRRLVEVCALTEVSWARGTALEALAAKWPDDPTRQLLTDRAVQDKEGPPRGAALKALAAKWPDAPTRQLLTDRAVQDKDGTPRGAALEALAAKWPDAPTRQLLTDRAVQDKDGTPRRTALEALAAKWPDAPTRQLLTDRAVQDKDGWVRRTALETLAAKWPDGPTRQLLTDRAVQDKDYWVYRTALETLASKWPDDPTRQLLTDRAVQDKDSGVRRTALETLAAKWPDGPTRQLLTDRAVQDKDDWVRRTALETLASKWPDQSTLRLLKAQIASLATWLRPEIQEKIGAIERKQQSKES